MTARRADGADDPDPREIDTATGGQTHDVVDEAGECSFPSSDPPSWTTTAAA